MYTTETYRWPTCEKRWRKVCIATVMSQQRLCGGWGVHGAREDMMPRGAADGGVRVVA